ncbi:MAG: UpxY family transcription antiterminator [Cyclonatronaceae bacterium]
MPSQKKKTPLPKAESVKREIRIKNEPPRWYALRSMSRQEKKLHEELQESGFKTYLPMTKELRQWSDRKKWVSFPMFRGYLFLYSSSRYFPRVLEHPAAVHIVRLSGKYAAIPDDQIEFIKKVADNQLRYEVTEQKFEKGDAVEIVQGPLKGCSGIWVKQKTKYNVSVHIEQLSSVISVEIPAAFIKKIPTEDPAE